MQLRRFLFLQGVCSPFFACLAERLIRAGHRVHKVNFNGGDAAYWRGASACSFRGRLDGLPAFFKSTFEEHQISDIVLFGDRRPIHRPAVELAQSSGIRVHVFEEGYFRPHWVTLERDGVNAHSLLPRDSAWYREVGKQFGDGFVAESFQTTLKIRAAHDVLYHLASVVNPLLYPGYRSHAPYIAPLMYAGYVRRFALKPLHERRDSVLVNSLISSQTPYYLLPLQLNSDAQIRDHSNFRDMADVMAFVLASFALHAPADSRLVIKNHPLDMGLVNYPRIIAELEARYAVVGRVDYLETGNLEALVQHARGTVTVNSTVGGVALQYGCPVITLSDPIYNLAGLTFQGELDQFWQDAEPPDQELFRCFKAVVIRATQINGGFYCKRGIELAVQHAVPALTSERSPLERLIRPD
ncbi:capsular polysaccharide export protein [Trichlorobacter thiogenes]|uniref:Capsular polysaccharide export protein n=1 Tax=Trichlorobacter thiogenes TaxID=115783 RepID=A0A1T4QGA2_9BACT|nr:capsular biosynthesis protein [Trichlorobacter thiogenes]SKA02810.1 capsular polysaccharide export protein [Trichlorobacter thiogenes]